MKRLLDVGNCGPDHAALTDVATGAFDVEIVQAHGLNDALEALSGGKFDLVTVNRLMDRDGSSGLEIIRQIKQHPELASIPVMMITNYAEHQQAAQEAGAVEGFGKLRLFEPETASLLGRYLDS